ncbi:hypothetical protein DNH61_07830 [Paenibacillus sambharensis]|uniref:Uncharacterized protein n=1 Tax=Paenibacillus sambharensis TaxID=1803190 RepID=A0A2W1LE93_9BACL|nr:phage holin family protein [Paenibacillus sambharensis]PZD96410.1 hypothetical protein DNH61_07830 [Paenibacillus sambharensis]
MDGAEWSLVFRLLDTRLLIVLVACWLFGYMLKRTPIIPNWAIVYLVTLVSVIFTIWLLGFGPIQLLQGFLCGAVSVYGYQVVKQGAEAVEYRHKDLR